MFPAFINGLPRDFWGMSLLGERHFLGNVTSCSFVAQYLRDPMLLSQLDPLPRVDRMRSCPKINGSGTGRWADETLVVDHSAWEAPQDARPRTETQTRGVVR